MIHPFNHRRFSLLTRNAKRLKIEFPSSANAKELIRLADKLSYRWNDLFWIPNLTWKNDLEEQFLKSDFLRCDGNNALSQKQVFVWKSLILITVILFLLIWQRLEVPLRYFSDLKISNKFFAKFLEEAAFRKNTSELFQICCKHAVFWKQLQDLLISATISSIYFF